DARLRRRARRAPGQAVRDRAGGERPGRRRAAGARAVREAAGQPGDRGLAHRTDRALSRTPADGGPPLPIDPELLRAQCARTLERSDLPELGTRYEGKVRDSYVQGNRRTIVATDRI